QRNLHLTARQLFQHQTISELARVAGTEEVSPAEQGPVAGDVALTPVQRWFLEQDLESPDHYTQALLFDLSLPVSADRVRASVIELMARHDALRLRVSRAGE